MAGKPKRMSQVKQLLQLHQQGKGKKEIARMLGISKNTVKAYLEKLTLQTLSIDDLLSLDDPVLEMKFHPGNPAYSDDRFDQLKSKLDYYIKELSRQGVTRKLLWEEYRQEHPQGYGHTQFCYHLAQHTYARKPSMVLQHKPGEKLFIDFAGKTMSYIERQSGEIVHCQVFVACLPHSDYSFVMAVRSQGLVDFLHAAYKPKDKALVENQVKLIYTRIYAKLRNEMFFDLESLNRGIKEKTKDHNQTRMQQKPFSREECFLASEKHLLAPLPTQDFELKYYRQAKVAKNNHILLGQDKHYYSVPFIHIGKKAKVIYTRSMVYIYIEGKQVAVHPRSYSPNPYSTTKEHLCSHHQHYLDRSPDYYLEKAKSKGDRFHAFIMEVFKQKRYPEQLYRSCDGFLSLQRKTDPGKFSKACALALEYRNYSYSFLANIIKNNTTAYQEIKNEKSLPQHDNVRGKAYYE